MRVFRVTSAMLIMAKFLFAIFGIKSIIGYHQPLINSHVNSQMRQADIYNKKVTRLFNIKSDLPEENDLRVTSQVARMNALAAKLRAEAAQLEAEQRQTMVEKLSEIFNSFDTNKDGKISIEELRDGLSKTLKSSVNEEQAAMIMKQFDTSGDGALQLNEFQAIETFRSKLDKILYEEQQAASSAQLEAVQAKVLAKKAERIATLINNAPPSPSDRVLSTLPFLLPLLDLQQYSRFIMNGVSSDENPALSLLRVLCTLYQNVPFSGLIAFLLFNFLSTNLRINRLVRYNIQLAIFLDIALIFPGLIGTTAKITASTFGAQIPQVANEVSSDLTLFVFSTAILYSVVSSLLGKEPDKLPFITERIKDRVPTTEEFQKLYEEFEKIKEDQGKPPSKK